jgi:hypothetical protein
MSRALVLQVETACSAWGDPPMPCRWPHRPILHREVLTPKEWRRWGRLWTKPAWLP